MAQETRGRARNIKQGGKHILRPTGRTNLKPRVPGTVRRTRVKSRPKQILDLSRTASSIPAAPKDKPKPRAIEGRNVNRGIYTQKPRRGAVRQGPMPKAPSGRPPARPAKGSYKASKQAPAPAPKPAAPPPPPEPEKKPEPDPGPETPKEPKGEINWSKLISAVREAIEFDEEEYSASLGVSVSTLRKYEKGSMQPGAEKREAILDDVKDHTSLNLDDFRE